MILLKYFLQLITILLERIASCGYVSKNNKIDFFNQYFQLKKFFHIDNF